VIAPKLYTVLRDQGQGFKRLAHPRPAFYAAFRRKFIGFGGLFFVDGAFAGKREMEEKTPAAYAREKNQDAYRGEEEKGFTGGRFFHLESGVQYPARQGEVVDF
jgi:hypothetical protein